MGVHVLRGSKFVEIYGAPNRWQKSLNSIIVFINKQNGAHSLSPGARYLSYASVCVRTSGHVCALVPVFIRVHLARMVVRRLTAQDQLTDDVGAVSCGESLL